MKSFSLFFTTCGGMEASAWSVIIPLLSNRSGSSHRGKDVSRCPEAADCSALPH